MKADLIMRLLQATIETDEKMNKEKTSHPNGRVHLSWSNEAGSKRVQVVSGLWNNGFEIHIVHPDYNTGLGFLMFYKLSWQQAIARYDEYVEIVKRDGLPDKMTSPPLSPMHACMAEIDRTVLDVMKHETRDTIQKGKDIIDTLFEGKKKEKPVDKKKFWHF